jgi:hypothetical protein
MVTIGVTSTGKGAEDRGELTGSAAREINDRLEAGG